MKKNIVPLFLATSVAYSMVALADLSDDEYRACSVIGDSAEAALTLRYGGISKEVTNSQLGIFAEDFKHISGIALTTMVTEAYQRPYRRGAAAQAAEAADFGRVYYEGCILTRGQ